MRTTKSDFIAELVEYVNTLEPGSKTVAYMTALLISWKDLDHLKIQKIVNETKEALEYYKMINEAGDIAH